MNIRNRTTAAIKPTVGFCTFWNLGEDCVRATTTEMPKNAGEVHHHSRPALEEEAVLGCQCFVIDSAAKPETRCPPNEPVN